MKEIKVFTAVLLLALASISGLSAQTDSTNADSLLHAFFKTTQEKKLNRADFVQSTEKAYNIIDIAEGNSTLTWKELIARERLTENRKILRVLRKVLKRHTNNDFRNLQLYQNMLQDIRTENQTLGAALKEKKQAVLDAQATLMSIPEDTIIRYMILQNIADTTKGRRTKKLQQRWSQADASIQESLDSINRWIGLVSMQGMLTSDLLQKTDSLMQQNSLQALRGDYPFLWEKQVREAPDNVSDTLNTSVATEHKKIIRYYLRENFSSIVWQPLAILLVFFLWTRRLYRRYRTALAGADDEYLLFTRRSRIAMALVVSLSLFPLFDVHAPWFFLLINQCVVSCSVIFLYWQKGRRSIVPVLVFLLAMMCGVTVINSIEPGMGQRIALIAFNLVAVLSTFYILPRLRALPHIRMIARGVAILYLAVNVLAIISNIFGRIIIAEGLSNAGIVGIVQIITLSVLLQAVSETLYLRLMVSRSKRNISSSPDYKQLLGNLSKPVVIFVSVIWLTMFLANVYLYEMISGGIIRLLTSAVNIGSLSFTIGNIVLFLMIIWIAHLLQKYIGAFFGDEDAEEDFANKKERSRMMVIKLVVLCIGYLLAVAVSGLPVDKITIIIGALGVGVGMGLQSIVNNFVSGVVLIFDRPLQIGDSVEVGDNSGKVKNIGIRSTTLLTAEGAEVIIPNGDILSRPIKNWTLSNTQRRIQLDFTLQTNESKDSLSQMIREAISSAAGVTGKEPVILFDQVKDNEVKLKIFFWCSNTNQADWIKSETRYLLYGKFREKNINVL